MRTLTSFVMLLLLIAFVVLVGQAQKEVKRPEPDFDRDRFEKSAKSVARPDLLVCRNQDAKITRGSDLSVEEFSRMLNGVWVNQNRRTVHGLPVETDTAFYIEMHGATGTAILIDRNNLNDYSLTSPYLSQGSRLRKTARPLTMTFVNCTFQFLDQYIKVSDEVQPRELAVSTNLALRTNVLRNLRAQSSLEPLWRQLVSSGYFNSFNMVTNRGLRTTHRKLSPVQGDGTRVAILPDGTMTDEKRIEQGLEPGSEYNLPMMVGALFKITLTPVKKPGRAFQSVRMRWDAEYRGVGVAMRVGEPVLGIEQGEFLKEGNACVSAVSLSGPDAWMTSECGNKNGLVQADAVSNPALTNSDLKPTLIFDRVVIGAP
jgi:hypothetical protein